MNNQSGVIVVPNIQYMFIHALHQQERKTCSLLILDSWFMQ